MAARQNRPSPVFFACWLLAALLCSAPAEADIYSYIDKDGVVHFTNIPRRSKKWKRVMKTGPGKAAAPRGSKVDRIPPRDHSSARYTRYDQHILEAAALYHIPVPLVRAVISVESDFDPHVVSRVGAQGLMQLMPQVSKGMGVDNPFDPRQNIFGGVRFLRILANQFAGDLVLTVASYHAGAGAVRKYGGIPPYETTQKYVRWVLGRYYKNVRVASR
jgi:soluble lytic murein transglycosylase-like protein